MIRIEVAVTTYRASFARQRNSLLLEHEIKNAWLHTTDMHTLISYTAREMILFTFILIFWMNFIRCKLDA